jgi:hypothetical protein
MKTAATILISFLLSSAFLVSNIYCNAQPKTDSGNALSESKLRQMLAQSKPGDTVLIPGGIYHLSEPIVIQSIGRKDAWITIMPKQGEEVIFDGSTYLSSFDTANHNRRLLSLGIITLKGGKYIRLKNIKVQNSHAAGIMVTGKNTSHIELMNCKVDGSFNSGIGLWYADSCKILNCEVTKANDMERIPTGLQRPSEAPHEAISVAGATHFEVAYNLVHDGFKEGIDVKEVSAYGEVHHNKVFNMPRQGLYVDSWFGRLHQVEFHHNEAYNCEWGMAVSAEDKNSSMDSIFIHHNLLYNNRASGMLISAWGENEDRRHIYIYNNTIVNNGSPKHWAGLTGGIDIRSRNIRDVFIYNNITAYNYGFAVSSIIEPSELNRVFKDQNIVVTHNLEWHINTPRSESSGNPAFRPAIPMGGDFAIKADPQFKDRRKHDFYPAQQSPVINRGWKEAPFGKSPNLGALEK